MRYTPFDELPGARGQADVLTLGFPFHSERAATTGDPSLHRKQDAEDLFLLALMFLSALLGLPDFPSQEEETPEALRRGDGPIAIWDYDYHVEILEVVAESGQEGLFRVTLRREP